LLSGQNSFCRTLKASSDQLYRKLKHQQHHNTRHINNASRKQEAEQVEPKSPNVQLHILVQPTNAVPLETLAMLCDLLNGMTISLGVLFLPFAVEVLLQLPRPDHLSLHHLVPVLVQASSSHTSNTNPNTSKPIAEKLCVTVFDHRWHGH
jgi:hypothetical protein